MIVDVVLMRLDGHKLPAAEVKASEPVRGRLLIRTRPWRESWAPHEPMVPTTFAYLFALDADERAQPLHQLREAHVNALDESFVIVGIQRRGTDLRPGDVPQAWWCRVVE